MQIMSALIIVLVILVMLLQAAGMTSAIGQINLKLKLLAFEEFSSKHRSMT
ncbi:MAG: hypothetical protein ACN6NI_10205 [Acinetobacter sp.]